jgi:HAD superfamily hydrolase (TIGR01662 family)
MASVIVFDAFGTLMQRAKRRVNPYARLIPSDESKGSLRNQFLTRNVSIDVFAQELGLAHLIPLLERELQHETDALTLYPDVDQTLAKLRGDGYKIAVCSNLAFEYCPAVRRLLPGIELIFSCEAGAAKPQPEIYAEVCKRMACRQKDVIFIGDSKRADFEGPQAFGMSARLIDRAVGQSLLCVLDLG